MLDVLVVGAGPAGRAVAAGCAEHGLRTGLLDPAPARSWHATYGAWLEELPPELPRHTLATVSAAVAVTDTRHRMREDYAVLDTPALREHLDQRMAAAGVSVRTGRFDRDTPAAAVVIDAGGPGQPLSIRHRRPGTVAAEQCAVGVVVPAELAAPLVSPGQAVFMDWRPVPGCPPDPATFLYAVPLAGDRVLLEETSLARRPGLPLPVLRARLTARLAAHRICPPPTSVREHVRFPLDLPRHRAPGVLGFGAAAPLTHPATGYQLATALRLATPVALALADGLDTGPGQALDAASRVLWPAPARATHLLRRRGLESLLRLPAGDLPAFFAGFFRLSGHHQHSYLSARMDPAGTAAAMAAMFGVLNWPLRFRLIGSSLLVSAPPD